MNDVNDGWDELGQMWRFWNKSENVEMKMAF